MKKILVAKGVSVNYGASKSSSTLETALTPDALADGAIGIYGQKLSDGKWYLLSRATASTTGIVLYSEFVSTTHANRGDNIMICRGVAVPANAEIGQTYPSFVGTPIVNWRTASGVTKGKENEQALADYYTIGYDNVNATAGSSFNFPTFTSDSTLLLSLRYRKIGGVNQQQEETAQSYDVSGLLGLSAYDAAVKLVNKINADTVAVADIVSSIIVADTAPVQATGSYIFTKGSNIITNGAATAGTIVVGDYLRIQNLQPISPVLGVYSVGTATGVNSITAAMTAANSIIYKVTAVVGVGTSITLDRPYTGESQTISVANFNAYIRRITSLSTSLGIRIIGQKNYKLFPAVIRGTDLQSATITSQRGPSTGSGSYNMISDLERNFSPYSGQLTKTDGILNYTKPFPVYADSSCDSYDSYFTTFIPQKENSNIAQDAFMTGLPFDVVTVFPTGNAGVGTGQYDYDTIIASLSAVTSDVVLGS